MPEEHITMLHIFPSFAYGGQQARLATLARGLGSGFRHLVLSLDEDISARALFDENAPVEFNTYKMEKSRGFSLTNIFTFRKLLRTTGPDILCTYNWGTIEAAIANRMGPRLPHIHFEDGFGADETSGRANRKRDITRRIVLSNSTVVVPSNGLKQAAAARWKLKPEQIRFIENGVDAGRLNSSDKPATGGVVVGSLGALRKEKNYERLIKSFMAADRDGKARLEIFGEGPEKSQLASTAGDDERIHLSGATSTPGDAYARFDVFALSSDTEQAPISLMEAMASGLPVVATNVGDIAKMVAEENLPFVTPLGNEAAYAEALAQMLQNPSARATIGAANRRKAREAFSLERMVEAHRVLYQEAAARK